MTHFCGVIDWRGLPPDGPAQRMEAVRAMARGGGLVREHRDATAWIACLDQGHFAGGGLQRLPGGDVGCVSGQPLLEPGPRDAAALLAAVAAADEARLAGVRGQFAACTWSPASRTLRLCADALAVRPIYVNAGAGRVLFATSLRVLRTLVGHLLPLDERGLADRLHFGFELGSRTVHAGVCIAGPGEMLEFRKGFESSSRYLDWTRIDTQPWQRDEAIEALHTVFREAVMLRQPAAAAEATLSGGMDSRAVVAALVDAEQRPRTWCLAYPGSADEALARMAADAMRVEHQTLFYTPEQRLRTSYIPVAQYLRRHWSGQGTHASERPVCLWTGHGGSVGLGHVYMDRETVELASQPPHPELAPRLLPRLGRWRTSLIPRERLAWLRELARRNVAEELERCGTARPDRRLYLFYLLNDQSRHLHRQNEDIDLTGIEMLTPMLDSRLLRLIASMPTEWFLGHALYNDWLARFRTPAIAAPWQSYPGHLPSPVPVPGNLLSQWDLKAEKDANVRKLMIEATSIIQQKRDQQLFSLISPVRLRLAKLSIRMGSTRFAHDVSVLRQLDRAITGTDAIADPPPGAWKRPELLAVAPHQLSGDCTLMAS